MINHASRLFLVISLILALSAPRFAFAAADQEVVLEEKPSALAMTGDLIIARPVMMVITAVGSVVFVISLPFSLAGGNTMEAANTLVVKPAITTFVRCLGCSNPGYKKVVNKNVSDEE